MHQLELPKNTTDVAHTQDKNTGPAVGTQTNHFPNPVALMNRPNNIFKKHPILECETWLAIRDFWLVIISWGSFRFLNSEGDSPNETL